MGLTREQILRIKPRLVEIDVPEWGGTVHVRLMSAGAREKMLRTYETTVKEYKVQAELLVNTLCDSSGTPLFTLDDIDSLNAQDCVTIEKVCAKVSEICFLDKVSEAKNDSPPTP